MSTATIRNVVFDFGGVIVRWQPQQIIHDFTQDEALRALLKTAIFQHPDWLEMDRGTLSDDEAAQRFSERTRRPISEMALLLQRARESLTPIPETVDLLHDLAAAGIPLFGLSNMPASTFEFLRERDPHWRVFRGVVISGEIKMIKPDPQIFEHLASTHQLEPAETLFLDDLAPNIEVAKRSGFQTMLFDDPPRRCAELRRLFKLNGA